MHVRVGFEEPFFASFDGAAEFAVLGAGGGLVLGGVSVRGRGV